MKIEMIGNVIAGLIAASAFLFAVVVLGNGEAEKDQQDCHKLFTSMSKAMSKKQLEEKIEQLKQEAAALRLRLSSIEDQIGDFVGDLRMMEHAEKQTS